MDKLMDPMKGTGRAPVRGHFYFDVNGTSDPSSATYDGSLKRFISSVTYGATGKYTIQFTSDFVWPTTPRFLCSEICESGGTLFKATQVGAYNAATRQLVVQTIVPNNTSFAGAAITAPATAGNAGVVIEMMVNNSQGK